MNIFNYRSQSSMLMILVFSVQPATSAIATSEKTISETFTNNATADYLISRSGSANNRERIVYSDDTGFGWGAYNAETAGSGALIIMRDNANDIRIKDSSANGTNANQKGTYLYSIFAENSVARNTTPTDSIDLSDENAAITLEVSKAAPGQQLRFLLRGAQNDWFLSDNSVAVSPNSTRTYSLAGFSWKKVSSGVAADMNQLDNGGDRPMSLTAVASAAPGQVTGGGFYIQKGFSDVTDELRVRSIAWHGYKVHTAAPIARITFPPALSLTPESSLTVQGTASDTDEITLVRVNGVDATSSDGFANWQVVVPLLQGNNTLQVQTSDIALNTNNNAAQAVVTHSPVLLERPADIVLDSVNNRALVVDSALDMLVAVDLSTGLRTLLSGPDNPDDAFSFNRPTGLALDSANNRALMVGRSVISVDLDTGVRRVISSAGIPDSTNPLGTVRSVALDAGNNRLLVINNQNNVLAVDLKTGARSVFSGGLRLPQSITLDSKNNRALVLDTGLKALVAIDLNTGARTLVSDATASDSIANLIFPRGLTFDATNNRVITADRRIVLTIDLSTGFHTEIANPENSEISGDSNSSPQNLVIDTTNNNRLLVADSFLRVVMEIDLNSGIRTAFSHGSTPDASSRFVWPIGHALDRANNRLIVGDSGRLVEVDLETGARTVISDKNIPNNINPLVRPLGVLIDSENNRALVINQASKDDLIAVDLETGVRTVFSQRDISTGDRTGFKDLVLDSVNKRVLLIDTVRRALVAIDLETGVRSVISDNSTQSNTVRLREPQDLVLDSANNRVLVIDADVNEFDTPQGESALLAIDLDSGVRSIISNNDIPNSINPINFPMSIALDSEKNRVLVSTLGSHVLAIDLETGLRTKFISQDSSDMRFIWPVDMTFDSENNRLFMTDLVGVPQGKSILVAQPDTGGFVILSK